MKSTSAVSLSFLDLLTCCLGSMLLLFFVIVLLRQSSDAGASQHGAQGDSGESDRSLVVITATAIPAGGPASPPLSWKLVRGGSVLETPPHAFQSVTDRYAVFYSTSSLPRGTQLHLDGGDESLTYQIHVFTGNRDDSADSFEVAGENPGRLFEW